MNELALFAGVGGGILGGKLLGWKTICAIEKDGFCREVLLRRQADKMLPLFPIWDDIKTFRQDNSQCNIVIKALCQMDNLIITAGFPCQPYSSVGKGKGEGDKRNLWPDTMRIIREVGPRFVLLENVPGLLRFDYFGKILGDLADAGFDAEWDIISAAEVGALHRRRRLWILAWSHSLWEPLETATCKRESIYRQSINTNRMLEIRSLANTTCPGKRNDIKNRQNQREDTYKTKWTQKGFYVNGCSNASGCWWDSDPAELACIKEGAGIKSRLGKNTWGIKSQLGRVADGVADRMDRLSAIGNGQVSLVAAIAFVRLARRAGFML